MKHINYLFSVILIHCCLFAANVLLAQEETDKITIGKNLKIYSEVLNEERNIFISTPRGYDRSQYKYPVLYVLDGQRNFQFSVAVVNFLARNNLIPQMIVVGIPNTDRGRDFSPTTTDRIPNSGGADNFLKFTNNELFPFIEEKYRTQPYRILCGHSLCGMFSVYTLFTHPDMFNAHVAISPYLMYDEDYVVTKAESVLQQQSTFNNILYITLGDEPTYTETLKKFTTLLKEKTNGLQWDFSVRKSEDHGSIPLKSLYDGLEFIYSDWRIPNEVVDKGIKSIKKQYKKLSEKYSYQIEIPEFFINNHGYRLLNQGKINKALELFKYNVQAYPNSANVYDSLGEGYENDKQFEKALDNYKIAVNKGKDISDPNLQIYKQHIDRVIKKMAERN